MQHLHGRKRPHGQTKSAPGPGKFLNLHTLHWPSTCKQAQIPQCNAASAPALAGSKRANLPSPRKRHTRQDICIPGHWWEPTSRYKAASSEHKLESALYALPASPATALIALRPRAPRPQTRQTHVHCTGEETPRTTTTARSHIPVRSDTAVAVYDMWRETGWRVHACMHAAAHSAGHMLRPRHAASRHPAQLAGVIPTAFLPRSSASTRTRGTSERCLSASHCKTAPSPAAHTRRRGDAPTRRRRRSVA